MTKKKSDRKLDDSVTGETTEMNEEVKQIEELKSKNNDLLRTLQMIQADFENYKKRVERDRVSHSAMSNKDLILSILPAIDNFEIALKSKKSSLEDFVKGIELIYSQLLDILRKEGLSPIETFEKKFDPKLHECLMQEESDKESGTIIEEFQKGYTLKEVVVRPSKVKIAK